MYCAKVLLVASGLFLYSDGFRPAHAIFPNQPSKEVLTVATFAGGHPVQQWVQYLGTGASGTVVGLTVSVDFENVTSNSALQVSLAEFSTEADARLGYGFRDADAVRRVKILHSDLSSTQADYSWSFVEEGEVGPAGHPVQRGVFELKPDKYYSIAWVCSGDRSGCKIAGSPSHDAYRDAGYGLKYTLLDPTNLREDSQVKDAFFIFHPAQKEPVVIVPGIMGSRLSRLSDNVELWPDMGSLINPLTPADDYLDELKLDSSGKEDPRHDLEPASIIDKEVVFGFEAKLYGSLRELFLTNGYSFNTSYFEAPYDWRLDLREEVARLSTVISQALSSSPTGKVNIVAHSMGGLLVKEYLTTVSDTSFINTVIFAGVPNLGAPKAFKLLNYGDDMDLKRLIFGLNDQKAKEIGQNMPSVYGLLPSREYIARNNDGLPQDNGAYVIDLRDVRTALDYNATAEFLKGQGRNTLLLDEADSFHQARDSAPLNISPATHFYNIAGCGEPTTVGGLYIYKKGDGDREYRLRLTNGDGTVPLISSRSFSNASRTFFSSFPITGANHFGLVKATSTLQLIKGLIEGHPIDFASLPGISESETICYGSGRMLIISSHSPVELHVYDSQGRHTGPRDAAIELGIPGSSCEIIESNSFVLVPASQSYRIRLDATDVGSFDLDIQTIEGTTPIEAITYLAVPLHSSDARAEVTFSGSPASLSLDNNGDGVVDEVVQPSATLSGVEAGDTTPPEIAFNIPSEIVVGTPLAIAFSATDDLSGVALISTTLDGRSVSQNDILVIDRVGNHVLHVEASDRVGNPRVAEFRFNATYRFSGFLPPIKPDGTGIYKQGRALPVKFRLVNASGSPIPTAKATLILAKLDNGVPGTEAIPLSSGNAAVGNTFRYDPDQGLYIYNLSTTTMSPGTWRLKTVLDDGKAYMADVVINP